MMIANKISSPRPIRSYVLRQGRMTPGQKIAYDKLWRKYGIDDKNVSCEKPYFLEFKSLFLRDAPVILEVGFGMGEALIELAKMYPQQNFIGIDVHLPGIGAVLMKIENQQLPNVRILCADAVEVLNHNIMTNSLQGVHLFFPDPWPKKRHHKRRILQANFAELILSRLKTGGYFHMATDWEDYAKQMLSVMTNIVGFTNVAGAGNFSERPTNRPLTRFEQRGERLGHAVWDLVFLKANR